MTDDPKAGDDMIQKAEHDQIADHGWIRRRSLKSNMYFN